MQMHAAYRPGGHRRSALAIRLAVAMPTAGCAVALCACGSSGAGGSNSRSLHHAVHACGGLRKR